MCAIWGFVRLRCFDNSDRSRSLLISRTQRLAIASSPRGTDAAGMAWIRPTGKLRVWKGPCSPLQFAKQANVWTDLREDMPNMAIGHGRAATHGKASDNNNNHPVFSLSAGVALVHNGIISNHDKVITDCGGKRDGAVDTEALLRSVLHHTSSGKGGYPHAIRRTMADCSGGQAVALITTEQPDRLYLWRSGNPLWLGFDRELGVIWFASADTYINEATNVSRRELGFFDVRKDNAVVRQVEDSSVVTLVPEHGSNVVRMAHVVTKTAYPISKWTSGYNPRDTDAITMDNWGGS